MFEFVNHTGELAVKVSADTLEGLFIEAAKAMNEYLSEGVEVGEQEEAEAVEVEAEDKNALLVNWLSEILYRIEVNNKIYSEVRIQELGDRRLKAEIRGGKIKKLARDIKAVTHHDLNIKQTDKGYEVQIVFDI